MFASIMNLFGGKKADEPSNKPQEKKPERRNSLDRNLSCDEMDSDDLEGDLNLSDDESGAATRTQIKNSRAPA